MIKKTAVILTTVTLLFVSSHTAMAGIVTGGTRFVYPQDKKMITVGVENTDYDKPYLIQSWIEQSDGVNKSKHFMITPVLFQLDARQKGMLRILSRTDELPQDRETLFWLNIRGIPATEQTDSNKLQIVINSKFKLFYRPSGLSEPDYNAVLYKRKGNALKIINHSPYHLTVRDVMINTQEKNVADMILPFGEMTVSLPVIHDSDKITVNYVNDYGGVISKSVFPSS